MIRRYFNHIRHCLTIRRLLREHDTENLRNLYWYDMRLADAVSWRGILKVIAWGVRGGEADEISSNYALTNLYRANPPERGTDVPNPPVWHCKSLEDVAWHDEPSEVIETLEKNASAIIAEYHAIASEVGTHPDNASLTPRGRWIGEFLIGASGRNDELCRRCPVTAQTVESMPLCRNFGFAMFSGAEPGTHIAPHCGSSNLRLRHHLGVEIPEPEAARIRVGTEWRHWEQDRAIAFDDAFDHEVVHEGKQLRVVLSVDVWHPSLTREDIAVLGHPVFRDFGYARR